MAETSDRIALRQTIARFTSELDRVMGASFTTMPRPLEQLLDAIDCEPPLSRHMRACIDRHVSSDFDAASEVDRIAQDQTAVFGPYGEAGPAAAAHVYLILQELVRRHTTYPDPVFSGYDGAGHTRQECFSAFMNAVVMSLVNETRAYLEEQARALGMDDESATGQTADTGASTHDLPGGSPSQQLEDLIDQVCEAAYDLPAEDCEDALLQIEALREELLCDSPKDRVVRVLLRALRRLGGPVRFEVALDRLESAL